MPTLLAALLAGAVVLASLLVALRLVFGFRQFLRYRKYEPVEPAPIINPPEPVVRTLAGALVAWVAILWSVTNPAMLVAAGVILQGHQMLSSVPMQLSATLYGLYALVTAVLIGSGGVMLLRLMAWGRRAVAWGVALLGILNVLLFAFCLFLRQFRDTPPEVRRLMIPAAVVLAVHTLIGSAIGVAAQHVGLADQTSTDRPGGSAR